MEKPTRKEHNITIVSNNAKIGGNWETKLVSAEVMEERLKGKMSAQRLLSLAKDGFMPHFIVDGSEPLFISSDVKNWIAENLIHGCTGMPLANFSLRVVHTGLPPEDLTTVPKVIQNIPSLTDITAMVFVSPGIYFLCLKEKLVYIGQSVNPGMRMAGHADKEFDKVYLLPWPSEDLNRIEGVLIRTLRPSLNGKRRTGNMIAPGSSEDIDEKLLNELGLPPICTAK